MNDHHRFLVRQALHYTRYIEKMVEELDTEIAMKLKPYEKQMELACTVSGIRRVSAATILAETRMNMSPEGPLPDCHHLASWAAICPGNDESGGTHRSGKTRQGQPLVASCTDTNGLRGGGLEGVVLMAA